MTNEANAIEARELALYAVNLRDLYTQRAQPIMRNLARKVVAGTYDATLAVKAWRGLADVAAKRYSDEFGPCTFSPATRDAAAGEIAAHYAEELETLHKLERVWKYTHASYRGTYGGARCVMVNREGATVLVPLTDLSEREIERRLPKA